MELTRSDKIICMVKFAMDGQGVSWDTDLIVKDDQD